MKRVTMTISIADTIIAKNKPCFIIAEAGVNHDGSVQKAKQLIDIAKHAGADAVKFQTWITQEIVTPEVQQAVYQRKNTGKKESQYDMLKRLELSFQEFTQLKKYADKKGIIFLSTADDEKSVEFLSSLRLPAFKIGSGELTNVLILEKISQKKLPIILSTGMATIDEVKEAVRVIHKQGNTQIILLHCTSNYPTKPQDVNLRAMKTLHDTFHVLTGYSDHTSGITVPVAAVLLGACVIEKHFTYDKKAKGPDHKASLSPPELTNMVTEIRRVEKLKKKEREQELKKIKNIEVILGCGKKRPTASELKMRSLVRKSIVAQRTIQKGEVLTKALLSMKRPATGLSPAELGALIGKKAKRDIKKDEIITYEIVT